MENFKINKLLLCGTILGLISVIMGAFGDHALDLTQENVESLNTAIRYNMLYAVLITCIALVRFTSVSNHLSKKLLLTGGIFASGVILFSFGIYASIFTKISDFTYLTPLGGLIIIAGWIYAAFLSVNTHKSIS